jgi:hypothetical protein
MDENYSNPKILDILIQTNKEFRLYRSLYDIFGEIPLKVLP